MVGLLMFNLYFYPRSPCGERPGKVKVVEPGFAFLSTLSLRRATEREPALSQSSEISIHALLAESDHYDNYNLHCVEISIHALLAESDRVLDGSKSSIEDFYPRSPCGERRLELFLYYQDNRFLSTLSLRRATGS